MVASRSLLLLASLPLLLSPLPAQASRLRVGGTLLYALETVEGLHGLGGLVTLDLPLRSNVGLEALALGTTHPGEGLSLWGATLGSYYLLDILPGLFPFLAAGLGAYGVVRQGNSVHLGVNLAFGLDLSLSSWLALGGEVRYHLLVTDIETMPAYVTAGLRVVLRL